jgi:hypothetical protein
MKRSRRHLFLGRLALAVLVPGCVFAACLSSAPPAPAVRFFDASPEARAALAGERPVRLRFTGAPHLGREFAVRVGPRELVFDPLHSWIAEPVSLVEAAFASPPAAATAGGDLVEVHVATFELDLSGKDAVARVRLELRAAGKAPQVVDGTAPVASREPEVVAAAMAKALGDAARAAAGRL